MKSSGCPVVLIGLLSFAAAANANSPQQLAGDLQAALRNGDMDAELTLFDRNGVPGGLQFYFLEMVVDCVSMNASACTAVVLPPGDEARKKSADYATWPELEVVPALEGFIKVRTDPSREDGAFNTRLVEYAKIKGEYRVVSARFTANKLAEMRAKTAQSITDALLTKRVPASNLPKGTDWKAKASRLPNGGGEAGTWFVAHTNAIAAAYKASDVAAMRTLRGEYGQTLYPEKDYKGNPVPKQLLQLKLRAQAVRAVMDVTVLGGYQLGDTVALTYAGHDGAGWIVRGCEVLKRNGNDWEAIDNDRIEIPSM